VFYLKRKLYQGMVLRPESMSPPEVAWLLGFLGKLICDVDTLMDTQPFRVWVRFSFAEARGTGLTRVDGSGSLCLIRTDGWRRG
jgi:hypothetical protein